ncbi:epoxide hydrolase 4-like [Diaphorina citri]|uniref:Epoxide hydrolase 4-like n=1 Tax=Diaphorina citri TaxID=121845 RepID=A0A1S3D296_DIACI|nr:epoxide hydrolase 4-like [Diaphorina citri]
MSAAFDSYNFRIVTISFLESIKIHIFSFIWGLWTLVKHIFWRLYGKRKVKDERENAPTCLVDNSFGQHLYVKLKGVKFHYVDSGDKNKPVILFLHGFPDFWISWSSQVPALVEYFRVICLDLKGFGDSDKPLSRSNYKVCILLHELRNFICTLNISSCHVVGHDIGALLGWYLVSLYPQHVKKFVAISCPHPNLYWNQQLSKNCLFNSRWIQFSQLPHLPEQHALDFNIVNKCYQHLSANDKYKRNAYLDAYKYTFSRKEDWTGPLNYFRNLPFNRLKTASSTKSEINKVKVPVLLLTGSADNCVSLESIVRSTDFAEQFKLKIIDNSSHYPHQQQPDQVNNLLLNFLIDEDQVDSKQVNQQTGLVGKMYGAVSNTVKYGNHYKMYLQNETTFLSMS